MRIEALQLQTGDQLAQRRFYIDELGLAEVTSPPGTLMLQAGRSRLLFADAPGPWNGVYHFAFNIPPALFEEAGEWAEERVALIRNQAGKDRFHFENWDAEAFYFHDPAGNIVEFIARQDLLLSASSHDRRFSGQSILSVSEIGLASRDVGVTVRALRESAGVDTYGGEGSDTFAAVGDVEGLLIVVKDGRYWFPDTGIAAELLPIKALVAVRGGKRFLLSGPPYEVSTL